MASWMLCLSFAGVARRPLPFLCFVKEKEAKERRPQDSPYGCLRYATAQLMYSEKWEMTATRCAQTAVISDPFSRPHQLRRLKRIAFRL
ncbi:hypothetical protein KDM89_20245, partial [Undibacterium sp. LFS511W]|nr:hypothetical protein [Undibacterium luofuense]